MSFDFCSILVRSLSDLYPIYGRSTSDLHPIGSGVFSRSAPFTQKGGVSVIATFPILSTESDPVTPVIFGITNRNMNGLIDGTGLGAFRSPLTASMVTMNGSLTETGYGSCYEFITTCCGALT